MVTPILKRYVPTRFIPFAGELATVAPVIAQVSFVTPQLSEVTGSGTVMDLLQSVTAATCAILAGHVVKTGATLSPTVTCTVVIELHPFTVAVMVKVVVCSTPGVELVSVPVIVLPLPLVGIPVNVTELSRVHANEVPAIPFGLVMSI